MRVNPVGGLNAVNLFAQAHKAAQLRVKDKENIVNARYVAEGRLLIRRDLQVNNVLKKSLQNSAAGVKGQKNG